MNTRVLVSVLGIAVIGAAGFLLWQAVAPVEDAKAHDSQPHAMLRGQTARLKLEYPAPNKRTQGLEMKAALRSVTVPEGKATYEVRISLFAQGLRDVSLTPDQIEQIQDVYTAVYEARLRYELSKARVGEISPQERLIEIPSYSAIGDEFKETLNASIRSIVGTSDAEKVIAGIGEDMSADNSFFGKYSQTISVKFDIATGNFNITHMVGSSEDPRGIAVERDSTIPQGFLGSYRFFYPIFPKPSR
jgi:hypothetical protein